MHKLPCCIPNYPLLSSSSSPQSSFSSPAFYLFPLLLRIFPAPFPLFFYHPHPLSPLSILLSFLFLFLLLSLEHCISIHYRDLIVFFPSLTLYTRSSHSLLVCITTILSLTPPSIISFSFYFQPHKSQKDTGHQIRWILFHQLASRTVSVFFYELISLVPRACIVSTRN